MSEFFLGFAACYSIGVALEVRSVLASLRDGAHTMTVPQIALTALIWPVVHYFMGEGE